MDSQTDMQTAPHEGSASLVRFYSALECASHEMLQAARNGDWDSVCRLEGACAVVIVKVRQIAQQQHTLSSEEQRERMRILRAILANDAELRRICDPVEAMLGSRPFLISEASSTVH